jgi:G3E family GTPase
MLLFPSSDIGPFGRRQRNARGHRIPVTIARSGTAEGAAVVADDFVGDEVLIGDCPCCTIREKLLQAVHERASAGSISRLAIRTEADILPILRTFMAERALGNDFYVEDAPALEGDRFTLIERAPVRWDAFSRFITTLTALRGADLVHASGLMNIEGCRGPVAVQFMGHVAARPVELQAWPDGERVSRLEFVTRNIEERTVRDLFDAMQAAA